LLFFVHRHLGAIHVIARKAAGNYLKALVFGLQLAEHAKHREHEVGGNREPHEVFSNILVALDSGPNRARYSNGGP
jgi:hypothetical protein